MWSASTLSFSSGSVVQEHQTSKRRSPVASELESDRWTRGTGASFPPCRHPFLSEVLMSLAWGPPSCFSRRAQGSCTICQLYSDVSDTPQNLKKYVAATVSHPGWIRCFLEFESEFMCPCVHRAVRNEQFIGYALEFRLCMYCIFSGPNANLLHMHVLAGPVKARA